MSDEIKDDEKEIKPKKPAKVEAVEKPAEDFGGLVAFIRDGVTILRNAEESNELAKAGWVKK